MILEGRVMVNGKTVLELGTKADPDNDAIKVDGRRIKTEVRHRYIVLYKPKGYVTTRKDPEGRRTVMDLIGEGAYIYPVGRLDYDSEGLLLMMTDGDLAAKLMHPRHEVDKVYEVECWSQPTDGDLQWLREGVELDDGPTSPAEVRRLDGAHIELILHEGRNRQVRRMFEAVGHRVKRLHRSRYGSLDVEGGGPRARRPRPPAPIEERRRG